ncbi:MAG: alpha/beta hydrolase [Moraxellaceae bacterium]|jgi:acetyl esterase/lipase|nr:alpha/beta hydrolase [Moraxellaceae bacterium]
MKLYFRRAGGRFMLPAVLFLLPALPAEAGVWERLQGMTNPEARNTQGQTGITVTYTPAEWPQPLQGDLYLPAGSAPSVGEYPVVLLLHGGAWRSGDKASMRGLGQVLADRGYVAMSINYRLAPGARYPAPLQDMQQAVRWLQQHAGEYRLDMGRLAAWGYAAGGHLAALLAVQPPSDLPSLRVVVAGGAPMDLRAWPEAGDASVTSFIGGSVADIPALYDQASPITFVRPGLPPFFLYHGTEDQVVSPSQAAGFAAALGDAGVAVELTWLQGLDHEGTAAAAQIRPAALQFLDRNIVRLPGGAAMIW